MLYYPSSNCEDELPEHICDSCEDREKAKIRSAGFIRKTFAFTDPTDPTEWFSAIDAGDVIAIPEVTGTYDGGSEVEGPGYGDQSSSLIGLNHTANIKDPNYKSNANFWNMMKKSRQWLFFYRTGSQTHITDTTVSVVSKNPVGEDLNADVTWDVTVKWASPNSPVPFDTPPGVFDQCLAVQ